MANKKLLAATGLLASVGAAGVIGLSTASAETNDRPSNGSMSSLADKIAEKFSLNKDEVRATLDEHRDEMQEERHAKQDERLTQAVKDGKITEEQKSKILAKLEELRTQREEKHEEFQDMAKEERRATMRERHEELEKWAEDNDIPEEYLNFGHRGQGGGRKHF